MECGILILIMSGGEIIARDHNGVVVVGRMISNYASSVLASKTFGALEGLRLARSCDFPNVVMEVCSEVLVSATCSFSHLILLWFLFLLFFPQLYCSSTAFAVLMKFSCIVQ